MPCFKSNIFYQYSPKTKLFLKKKAKFSSAGGSAPRPPCLRWLGALPPNPQLPLAAGGFAPRPPKHPPQLRISGYAPATLCAVYNHMGFRSFCYEQFFLHRSVANLMILTIIDVSLIVFWLKSFIGITHCVTLISSCYIALSYLFAKA